MYAPNGSNIPRDAAGSMSINSSNTSPPYYGENQNVYKNNRRLRCGSPGRFWKAIPRPFGPDSLSQSTNRCVPKSDSAPRDRVNKQVMISEQPAEICESAMDNQETPVV